MMTTANDRPDNPGLTKAIEAARAVNGVVAVPDFGDDRPPGATDFNDLHQQQGADAVTRIIHAALESATSPPPDSHTEADTTTCQHAGGHFELTARGVMFHATDNDGNPKPPQWICSPLRIEAKTRDANGNAWGRLLSWEDDDGNPHQWAMPLALLQGDGQDLRRELADQGLTIAPGRAARELLASYLNVWPVTPRVRCVDTMGWQGNVYVTAHASIGQSGERVVFQNAHAIEPGLSTKGKAEQWRSLIASAAAGNSRLVFALSAAFAGPLVELAGADSGGFHLRGASSSGKSTALKLAASVWGEPRRYVREWRATTNGLEGLAALHNDGILILDELSQIDPRKAGEAAYLLANGQGKARANRTGHVRQSARWRLLFLSAGEQSLVDLMTQAGQRTNTGQEIRLADIAADAGADMGMFEQLHGFSSPSDFALHLNESASQYYGAAGMAWLHCIVNDRAALPGSMAEHMERFTQLLSLPADTQGQVQRVARRFALVASAGELASGYELTGWEPGEAITATRTCFAAWLDGFGGTGDRETRRLLEHVRAFFEAHGASRFERINANPDQRITNRAGFCRDDTMGQREYLVLPEAFRREMCHGFDLKPAIQALLDAGWLTPGSDGRSAQKPRLPGIGPSRCYVFNSTMWDSE